MGAICLQVSYAKLALMQQLLYDTA
jgi:hypothetical protein